MRQSFIVAAATLLLGGCTGPQLQDYTGASPSFDLREYFEGRTRAWGQFQDRFGKVRRRFAVDIIGEWQNGALTLTEDFVYDDGEREQRVWTLTPDGAGSWRGSAEGVVGTATGRVSGNAFNWRYTFDLKTRGDETLRVDFDDWLWRQDDNVVINRAYVSKLGIAIGEVLIFFSKDRSGDVGLTAADKPHRGNRL